MLITSHVINNLFLLSLIISIEAGKRTSERCRQLLACTLNKNCLKISYIADQFNASIITKKVYNDVDSSIDFGCIFAFGCMEQCDKCPLCKINREQLLDTLSGSQQSSRNECSILVKCAELCVQQSTSSFVEIKIAYVINALIIASMVHVQDVALLSHDFLH
ncbi:hypothetical protein LOAG_13804 [Loa loa]|uniref:Saposin B-type domain-containing protein n=1 Tax=Loa loa TaxID=7209 RepID=A0A1S0TK75_LOALO|nr:hypothetical protein LOAG_13804 [Loa loa]EFO14712.1 hypothetical protein LOAG_13804 [Loa loa]